MPVLTTMLARPIQDGAAVLGATMQSGPIMVVTAIGVTASTCTSFNKVAVQITSVKQTVFAQKIKSVRGGSLSYTTLPVPFYKVVHHTEDLNFKYNDICARAQPFYKVVYHTNTEDLSFKYNVICARSWPVISTGGTSAKLSL